MFEHIYKKFLPFILIIAIFTPTFACEFLAQGKDCLQNNAHDQAYEYFIRALQATNDQKIILEIGNNLLALANDYFKQGLLEKSAATYQILAQFFPSSSVIHHNAGYILNELARYQEAVQSHEKAIEINPSVENHFALSTALLAIGDYKRGWQEYEWRWKNPQKAITLPFPRWDGQKNLLGKKVMVISEGAQGDCLQFIRYAAMIKEMKCTVIAAVLPQLMPVLAKCPYIDQLISINESFPQADYWASLMSLPALLQTTIETVPHTIPYLFADSSLISYWKNKFKVQGIRVGVCWQADPQNDLNRPLLARRSFNPALLESLSNIPHVTLYSLQKPEKPPYFIHDFGNELDESHGRFMDTAAIIEHLDIVICVDTSIAHLAGALGKQVWLILPFKADWRWLDNNTNHSPWYPSMKIFRKKYDQSWSSLIEEIAQALKTFKSSRIL